MPTFFYVAKAFKEGNLSSGFLEAKDEHDLARILREKGYVLVKAELKEEKKKFRFSFSLFGRVSLVDKMMFTRNLKVMISAGAPLPDSLKTLAGQAKSKRFKEIILKIEEDITRGRKFSEALEKYPDVFDEIFINMIKVGEESGKLTEVLDVLARQMEKRHELRRKIRGAMVYPLVIICAMVIIGILMMVIVIPKLSQVFSDLGVELPLTTRIIIYTGNFLAKFWYIVFGFLFVFALLLRNFFKTKPGKSMIDFILLKIPLFSKIVVKTNSAYTTRTLASLISAGVPIVRAISITSKTLPNIYFRKALSESAGYLEKGGKLYEALSFHKDVYPNLVIQMVKVGEETGETSAILEKLADFYEEEVENITKNLSSIVEPILMLLIGGAVGFFAISVIQPIYGLMKGF